MRIVREFYIEGVVNWSRYPVLLGANDGDKSRYVVIVTITI